MPDVAEHDARYRDNRQFLAFQGCLTSVNNQWAAVVAFYSAVHLIEKLAAYEGLDNYRHSGPGSRELYLSRHPRHYLLLRDLNALRVASEYARYDSLSAFDSAFPGTTVKSVLIDKSLKRIEDYVDHFFASSPSST
jgi:hypothetical protein